MAVKHWFKVALMSQAESADQHPTVCGVQRVYVDGDDVMVDLANVFTNLGVSKLSTQLKVHIVKNSRVVAMEPMMTSPDKVAGIVMDAAVKGLLPEVPLSKIQEYILDLNNHVIPSARGAYQAANFNAFSDAAPESGDGE